VLIRFADGTEALANLVVGCDGIRSAVRAQFVVDKPVYSGRIAFRGIIPASTVEKDWLYSSRTVSWIAPNKHFLAFSISGGKQINIVAFVVKPEEELNGLKESWKNDAPREAIEEEYDGWCPIVQKMIQAMPQTISEWRINDREVLSNWVYMGGKVVLSGGESPESKGAILLIRKPRMVKR
jgi:salicylate hydroxylase